MYNIINSKDINIIEDEEVKTLDKFVYAVMSFFDERQRPAEERLMIGDQMLMDYWFDRTEELFNQAVQEAVIEYFTKIELDVVVRNENK